MKCCLCKNEYEGEGNNANPLSNQKCCDDCNKKRVIPARIRSLNKIKRENDGDQEV